MKHLVSSLCIAGAMIVFAGCSSKSYFEPKETSGKVSFDKKLPADVQSVSRDGAILSNGQVITKEGMSDVVVPQGTTFLSASSSHILTVDRNGEALSIDKGSKAITPHNLGETLVSGVREGNLLAGVTKENVALIITLDDNKTIYRQKGGKAVAIDYRISNPKLLNDLVILPTLDGKLLVVDKVTGKLIRDLTIGSDEYFNNIIFFDIIGNRLIAATGSKVMSISPTSMNTLDLDIRDVLFVKEGVYILTKDGQVILADADLKILKTRKFPFAHFIGAIHGKYLYALEREGYIVAVDRDLVASNTFKTDRSFDEAKVFIGGDKIFADNVIFELSKD